MPRGPRPRHVLNGRHMTTRPQSTCVEYPPPRGREIETCPGDICGRGLRAKISGRYRSLSTTMIAMAALSAASAVCLSASRSWNAPAKPSMSRARSRRPFKDTSGAASTRRFATTFDIGAFLACGAERPPQPLHGRLDDGRIGRQRVDSREMMILSDGCTPPGYRRGPQSMLCHGG